MKKKGYKVRKNKDGQSVVRVEKRFNMLISTVIVLSVLILGLVFGMVSFYLENKENRLLLENTYQKSFYDMADNMNDIEMKLSKLMVANSSAKRTELASEIWRQASTTESNLGQLPIEHQSISQTTKFVNQLGDYVYSLNKKLANGGKYTQEDEQKIDRLYEISQVINGSIKELSDKVGHNYRIVDHVNRHKLKKGAQTDIIGENFSNLETNTIDYPEMIYDGPFSDALDAPNYKHIKDLPEITEQQGRDFIQEKFQDTKEIEYLGLASGDLKTLEFSTVTENGDERYIQLTLQGGLPIMIAGSRRIDDPTLNQEQATAKAQEWAKKVLDEDLEGVWVSMTDQGIAYINLAPNISDVVYYPDLIKVKIALDTGELLGWEANSYLQNHVDRELSAPTISEQEAMEKAGGKLEITSTRLALIPKEWGTEVLAWEMNCMYRDNNYIVYVNALTGEEENILKVVKTGEQGFMLI